MPIRKPKPTSPGRRFVSYADFAEITKKTPEKSLTEGLKKSGGRNALGRKTARHRRGAQLARSAGAGVQLMAKEGDYATLRLPSGEMRMVRSECRATVGVVGNADHQNITVGKAGRKRHMGVRPQTRGTAMNPVDHPHGGGEGATPLGNHPQTPWGVPTIGYRTRKKGKDSDRYIVRGRRRGKKGSSR